MDRHGKPKSFHSISLSSKQIYASQPLSLSMTQKHTSHTQSPTVKSADIIHSNLWPPLHIKYNALMWKLDVKRHVVAPKSATVRVNSFQSEISDNATP